MVDEPPRNVNSGEEDPISQVQQGGTARVLLPENPACLNPYLPECAGAEALIGTVLEAPFAVEPGLSYKPLLIEQMPSYDAGTLSLDPPTVEMRLRANLAFSDGEPLTSADVKWTYEKAIKLAKDGNIAPPYEGFGRVKSVETPDERTVRLVFEEPYAFWRELLTAPILPRHVYEGKDFTRLSLTDRPVGSGPFLLEDWANKIQLTENQNYWSGGPLPNLEGIDITAPSPQKATKSLSTGRADFGFLDTTRASPDSGDLLRAAAAPVRVETLLFNSRKLDSAARETVDRAVDRERLTGETGGTVARSFVPPKFVPGYTSAWSDSKPDSPGTRDFGGRLKLVYPQGPDDPSRNAIVENIASDLSGAGIAVETQAVPFGKLFGEVLPEGNFDLALLTTGSPAGYETLLSSLPKDSKEALKKSLGTMDLGEQTRILRRAQVQMADDNAVLPLFVRPDTMAWSSTLTGPRPDTPYGGLLSNARDWAFYK